MIKKFIVLISFVAIAGCAGRSENYGNLNQDKLKNPDILALMTKQVRGQLKKYHENFGTKTWDASIAGKDMACQSGSLIKLLMQLANERYNHKKTNDKIKEEIADELSDMLSLVLFIAHELDIDIKDAWQKMLQSDENKFRTRGRKK